MPKPWVKLHRCVNDSTNFNRLCTESHFGGLLYFRIIAAADELGRLCGGPREVRRLTRMIDEPDEEVAEALDLIEKHELIERYTVDGEAYLVICNHYKYQDTAWERISQRYSCPAPPDWEENHPADLDDFLLKCGHQKQFPASRYGLADREIKSKRKVRKPKEEKQPKKLTPAQLAILGAWQAFDFAGQPSNDKGKQPGYGGLVKLVQEHGIPMVNEWAAVVTQSPPELPEGAEQWVWFQQQFRAALNRPWEWRRDGGQTYVDEVSEYWDGKE